MVRTLAFATLATAFAAPDECPFHGAGSPSPQDDHPVTDKNEYHEYLADLDVEHLYQTIVRVMENSEECWPADGPQDGDDASYAGLFGRLAWHCSGTLRVLDGVSSGGCEGGRQRFWPEREWRDNANLDKARGLLAAVKEMGEFKKLSWGDLITFAGTVGIKASGGPVEKFCFGRIDDTDGSASVMLGTEGTNECDNGDECISMSPCETSFHWPEQDENDNARCNLTQSNGRQQGSHSVGLIYVYPEGPQLKASSPEFDAKQVHQRSQRLSGEEVRDTFENRMGWTAQETVALIGGGHTLGRAHGNCASLGDDKESCKGAYTTSSGFEGAWTRTPSHWNYDYFEAMLEHEWKPTQSPDGLDQWGTEDSSSPFAKTFRLTADMSVVADPVYRQWAVKYNEDHDLFDSDFAKAWFKLTHRSKNHPQDDDLEHDANTCTSFKFVGNSVAV